eukprot:1100595-Rhodomonas_salina.1
MYQEPQRRTHRSRHKLHSECAGHRGAVVPVVALVTPGSTMPTTSLPDIAEHPRRQLGLAVPVAPRRSIAHVSTAGQTRSTVPDTVSALRSGIPPHQGTELFYQSA